MSTGAPRRSLPVLDPGAEAPEQPARSLSVGLILPFGEPREGFFPDTLLELCCARARDLGHRAALVRVYYEGDGAAGDALVRERLSAWLEMHGVDLVVAERVFDPAPILAHVARSPGRRAALVSWGDGDVIEGFDLVIGRTAGRTRGDRTRRSPSAGELTRAFEGVLRAMATGGDPALVPGVARVESGTLVAGADTLSGPLAAPLPRPFRPALDHDVIAARRPPAVTRKYLFGNAGCPFADDPAENDHYRGLDLAASPTLARLGCAFCPAGGDYQRRPDADLIEELVEQAAFYQSQLPDLRDLVIVDQHAPRLLAPLLRTAAERGLRPATWLFSARADAFVRDLPRLREAISVAEGRGDELELYLSGFEAFCDRELVRYNKGADVATLLRAVRTMRALAREHTGTFGYSSARGHSLILWSPWTTPEDLLETTANLRNEGLLDLFDDIGKNRLRLYEDLPITLAAARDGALTESWDEGDEGAAARKGYAVERPWSFLDPRTRLAFALARALRKDLGPETELPQLDSAARFATTALEPRQGMPTPGPVLGAARLRARPPLPNRSLRSLREGPDLSRAPSLATSIPALTERVLGEIRELSSALRRLAEGRGRAPVPGNVRAHAVLFDGPCNNGCAACANRDRYLESDEQTVLARIDTARNTHESRSNERPRAIVLAGREPSIHPAILRLVERAHGPDRRLVGLVTNGRRLAYRPFSQAIARAGLGCASVKIFAATATVADAISRDTGAHEQALAGLGELSRAGVTREIRLPLHRLSIATLEDAADLAARSRAHAIRVEAALDAIGLDHLREAIDALDRLEIRCAAHGVPLTASRLESGTRAFDVLPAPRAV